MRFPLLREVRELRGLVLRPRFTAIATTNRAPLRPWGAGGGVWLTAWRWEWKDEGVVRDEARRWGNEVGERGVEGRGRVKAVGDEGVDVRGEGGGGHKKRDAVVVDGRGFEKMAPPPRRGEREEEGDGPLWKEDGNAIFEMPPPPEQDVVSESGADWEGAGGVFAMPPPRGGDGGVEMEGKESKASMGEVFQMPPPPLPVRGGREVNAGVEEVYEFHELKYGVQVGEERRMRGTESDSAVEEDATGEELGYDLSEPKYETQLRENANRGDTEPDATAWKDADTTPSAKSEYELHGPKYDAQVQEKPANDPAEGDVTASSALGLKEEWEEPAFCPNELRYEDQLPQKPDSQEAAAVSTLNDAGGGMADAKIRATLEHDANTARMVGLLEGIPASDVAAPVQSSVGSKVESEKISRVLPDKNLDADLDTLLPKDIRASRESPHKVQDSSEVRSDVQGVVYGLGLDGLSAETLQARSNASASVDIETPGKGIDTPLQGDIHASTQHVATENLVAMPVIKTIDPLVDDIERSAQQINALASQPPSGPEKNHWHENFGSPELPHHPPSLYANSHRAGFTHIIQDADFPLQQLDEHTATFPKPPPTPEHEWSGFHGEATTRSDLEDPATNHYVTLLYAGKPYFVLSLSSSHHVPRHVCYEPGRAWEILKRPGVFLPYLKEGKQQGLDMVHVSPVGVSWRVRSREEGREVLAALENVTAVGETVEELLIEVKRGGRGRSMFWGAVWVGGLTGAIALLGSGA
jgi:hypothetical protein